MKIWHLFFLLTIYGCGDERERESERCRRGEEMELICQVDYVEKYETLTIPNWVKKACGDYYLKSGCYYEGDERHYWKDDKK